MEIVDPIGTICIEKDESIVNTLHNVDNRNIIENDGNNDDGNGTFIKIRENNRDECCNKSIDPETDDWEKMFDDNGDCLDPKLINELTAAVDKVTIDKPKTDYKVISIPYN